MIRGTVASLLVAVLAATGIILVPQGVAHAGVRPPTCGTPNTPPCVAA